LINDKISKGHERITNIENLKDGTPIKFSQLDNAILQLVSLTYFSNSFSIYEKSDGFRNRFIDLSLAHRYNEFSKRSNSILFEEYEKIKELYKDSADTKKENFELTKSRMAQSILPRNFLYFSDLEGQINFITHYKTEGWDFLPESLYVSFDREFFDSNQDFFNKKSHLNDKLLKEIEYILFRNEYEEKEKGIDRFKGRILIHLFLYLLKQDLEFLTIKDSVNKLIAELNGTIDIRNIPVLIANFILSNDFDDPHNILDGLSDFVKSFNTEFDSFQNCSTDDRMVVFAITEGLKNTLKKIFRFWKAPNFIFSFDWMDLSAGESALLTLFSNLDQSAQLFQDSDYVWLLIDEGELYLHPEWQRTFFSDLHKYLPLFFKEKKIQLFLTSHSPFIVSDLPKDNIILLNKDENGYCDVVDKHKFGETFGANIHMLFAESFFLKETFIGKFAENKILELIKKIKSKSESYETLKREIEIIGEPFLKMKLTELLEGNK